MPMSNAKPRKKPHITKVRAAVNAGPGARAPSGTGDSYPVTGGLGGGRLVDRGIQKVGGGWKNE